MKALRMTALGLLVVGVGLAGSGIARAQGGGADWRVVSAEPLDLPYRRVPDLYPAPDGRRVAFELADGMGGWQICLFAVIDERLSCYDHPFPEAHLSIEEPWPVAPRPLAWSPDGRRLAVTGQPLLEPFIDTDPVVIDLATGEQVMLLDDGHAGSIYGSDDGPATVDMVPTWSPDGTQLAFWRWTVNADDILSAPEVIVVPADGGEPRTVFAQPEASPDLRLVDLAWSPDGQTLALNLLLWDDEGRGGLWLIDLETGRLTQSIDQQAAIDELLFVHGRRFLDYSHLQAGLAWPLIWSPDGTQVLFRLVELAEQPSMATWPAWRDLDDGWMVSFSVERPAYVDPDGGWRFLPLWFTWSPDGSAILVSGWEYPQPSDDARQPLAEGLDFEFAWDVSTVFLVDAEHWGSMLLGHLPDKGFHQPVWGPEGDVLLSGNHLVLARE